MAKTDRKKTDGIKQNDMLDDRALQAFFDAARDDTITPSDALMTAILDDAAAEQPQPAMSAVAPPPDLALATARDLRRARGVWADLKAMIGGWPALAGMATATLAGVWIGFSAPIQLEQWSGGLILSGDYTTTEATFALEDMAPSYLGTGLLMEDEG
ncbi:hypothetical protein GCM10016455_12200 [Aliiroseovarius zhejiangensis]|uniref:Dihydroorotate dehydrogenase n=1 Tax=Aliiroseovarius zhejiangensis TaxID=1632025 RepID=A0ABQ3IWQ7_9RHOB|nr:hypothetical protein [Aliiroseovarius zhejiangensis]GHE93581.1 hypothetical protein GCM10016455_12200 [Aliiroseovarius zhejiangensis]